MATHSSVLAWRIPGTREPGGLPSMGWHRVRHDWSDLAAWPLRLSHTSIRNHLWEPYKQYDKVLGASVRNFTCGKGHEEGGSAYAKAGSRLRSPPGSSRASTPKTRVCLLSALCSHLHLWLYGGLSPTTSLWKSVNLQLQLIKFLGVTRVFQPTNSFGSPLACLNRFFRPHVIVQSLPTVRGMRCSKLSKYRFLWAVKRLIRNCIGEEFFTYCTNVCC